MKAHVRLNQITFEVEGELKDIFKEIGLLQEVFDAEHSCGCCKSTNIRFNHRKSGKYDYYEMVCKDCNARFQFGQAQEGGALFPKRREKGVPLPNGGWAKYDAAKEKEKEKAA